jgi:hypothetical protein
MALDELAQARRHYREVFGWPVHIRDHTIELPCGHDITAVAIPASWACNVTHRLASVDALGPVVDLPGPGHYWVLLAQANGAVETQRHAPPGVVLFAPDDAVPLPVRLGEPSDDEVRWVVAPDPARRRLPTLTSVLFAVQAIPMETKRAAARLLMRESASRGLLPWGSPVLVQPAPQRSRLAG